MDRLRYLEHFHDMVLGGIICGLPSPQEWLLSYARGIGRPAEAVAEMEGFLSQAEKELCGADFCLVGDPTEEELKEWFDKKYVLSKYYRDRRPKQGVEDDTQKRS